MKRFVLCLTLVLPLLSSAQDVAQSITINKLVIDSKKSFNFLQGDSTTSVIIDTLIMKNKSRLFFVNKKKITLRVNHAFVGKECLISGNDSKNNGTNLTLLVNFNRLESLFIVVPGEDAKSSNRSFNNGNGGNVELSYLSTGIVPQTSDKSKAGYIVVENRAGGYRVNAQTEIANIMGQVRQGSTSRPLGQLPNGRVYSGSVGKDGATTIKPVDKLN